MFLTDFIKRIFSKKKSINNLRQNLNSYTDDKSKKETSFKQLISYQTFSLIN